MLAGVAAVLGAFVVVGRVAPSVAAMIAAAAAVDDDDDDLAAVVLVVSLYHQGDADHLHFHHRSL